MKDIWVAYQSATPFFLAHLTVLLWILLDLAGILRETRLLAAGTDSWPKSRIGRHLLAVRTQRSEWSSSDQLVLQFADDMIDGFHNRLTLLLLIGIAGTFFGVFSLSLPSPNTKEDIYATFLRVLSNSVPVGFFGVAFSVIGYAIGGFPIAKFRQQVAESMRTPRALDARPEDALVSIQRTLLSAVELLRTSLSPLAGVEAVLADSLKPVIQRLDANFTQTQAALTTQFSSFGENIERFRTDLARLEGPIERLSTTAFEMTGAISQIDQVVKSLEQSLITRLGEYAKLDAAYATSIANLEASSTKLAQFPGDVQSAMTAAFGSFDQHSRDALTTHATLISNAIVAANEQLTTSGLRVAASISEATGALESHSRSAFEVMARDWRTTVQAYSDSVANTTVSANQQIATASTRAGESIEAAARTLSQFSANAGERLTRGIAEGAEILRQPLVEFHATIKSEFPEAIKEASTAIDRGLQHSAELARGLDEVGLLTRSLQEGIRGWEDFTRTARQLSADCRQASAQLEQALSKGQTKQGRSRWDWLGFRRR